VASAPISGTPPATVTAEQVADGVWRLAGQSHHSVLIEFSDHLVIVEAPNETRLLAVLAKAEELVPGKPVTKVVNTHHHFDHSGGVRAAVASGLTVITHATNEHFYRRMAVQPSTIVPDALSNSPQAISIETVADERTYQDESMTLELYHVAGNPHSASILMGYLPAQRMLIQVDLFTTGRTTPQLFAPNLLDNIERRGLAVDTVLSLHGDDYDIATLASAVAALRN
ncbi:MAG: MBL fold metallo-hydrolase, partial [Gammaproteobacteria bacterium]|nr:MBL fold metallo-hydrolase [Gammaproteobacteria bacterium]